MKKYKLFLISVLLVAFIAAGCSAIAGLGGDSPPAAVSADAPSDGVHTISVSGTGSVSMVPDMASISIGVQTDGSVASVAVSENSLKVEQVLAVLAEFGVDSRDISTTNFSVSPIQTRNARGEVTSTTFRVQNTVHVTVNNLDSLGAILDGVVAAGANTINGINFELNDVAARIAKDEALADAIADARRQADMLADAAGVVVIDVISINVSSFGGPVPYAETLSLAVGGAGDVPVAVGETDITFQVYVVFMVVAGTRESAADPAAEPTITPTLEAEFPPDETPQE